MLLFGKGNLIYPLNVHGRVQGAVRPSLQSFTIGMPLGANTFGWTVRSTPKGVWAWD